RKPLLWRLTFFDGPVNWNKPERFNPLVRVTPCPFAFETLRFGMVAPLAENVWGVDPDNVTVTLLKSNVHAGSNAMLPSMLRLRPNVTFAEAVVWTFPNSGLADPLTVVVPLKITVPLPGTRNPFMLSFQFG